MLKTPFSESKLSGGFGLNMNDRSCSHYRNGRTEQSSIDILHNYCLSVNGYSIVKSVKVVHGACAHL